MALQTRYVMKYRHCEGKLVLKVTDDREVPRVAFIYYDLLLCCNFCWIGTWKAGLMVCYRC